MNAIVTKLAYGKEAGGAAWMCLQNLVILGQAVLEIYDCLTLLRTTTTTADPMTIGQNDA